MRLFTHAKRDPGIMMMTSKMTIFTMMRMVAIIVTMTMVKMITMMTNMATTMMPKKTMTTNMPTIMMSMMPKIAPGKPRHCPSPALPAPLQWTKEFRISTFP